jgi:hypothetical protein
MIMTPISPGAGTYFRTVNGVRRKRTGKSLEDYIVQKNSISTYMYWDCRLSVALGAKYMCFVVRCPAKHFNQPGFPEEFKRFYHEPMMVVYEIVSYSPAGPIRSANGWVNEYVNVKGEIMDHSNHVTLTLKRKSLGKFKWNVWKYIRGMSQKEAQMGTFKTSENNKINGSYFCSKDEIY